MGNVLLSNVKRSIGGAYHAFKQHKYARRYLGEAAYRFNRRFHTFADPLEFARVVNIMFTFISAIIVNRERPTLVDPRQIDPDGTVDAAALARGLRGSGVEADFAGPLARQMAEYAARQQVQNENAARLSVIDAPRIELPELNPPVGLGELHDLAGWFVSDRESDGRESDGRKSAGGPR